MEDTPSTSHPSQFTGSVSSSDPKLDDFRKVCDEQDRAREALKRRLGVVEVAVDLVREARDE